MERVKWKQAVKVDKNATAIMKLSCVQRCENRPNGEFLYRLIDGSYVFEGMWLCEDLDGKWHGFTEYEWAEVIGNIHDNPKLLKQKK